MPGRAQADHRLPSRLAGAFVAVTAFEALLFESWPAVAVAAVLAAADALGRRSPYALLARLVSAPPEPEAPSALARVAALQRAALLAVAAGLLASDHLGAAWVVGGVAILEAGSAALTGRPLLGLPGPMRPGA